ncbi:MAG: hypothetical protein JOZ51_08440 [Chloroflexi bacterium]|nr:hypothetical protein [Chloroflexota bacterium]
MKLSRELYGLVLVCLFFFGGLYLVTVLVGSSSFARLADRPWLLPIINLATVSIFFFNLYRGMSPAGKIILRDHALLAVGWFVAWIVLIAVLLVPNDQLTWEQKASRALFSWTFILPHSALLILLAEKWQSAERLKWLLMAGLSFVGAIIFIYVFATV